MVCCGIGVVSSYWHILVCTEHDVTVDLLLLLLFIAGGYSDKEAVVYNELDQLRNDSAESLEQSLVRRGEMTPFGTVVNNSIEVHYVCSCNDSYDTSDNDDDDDDDYDNDNDSERYLLCSCIFMVDNAHRHYVNN